MEKELNILLSESDNDNIIISSAYSLNNTYDSVFNGSTFDVSHIIIKLFIQKLGNNKSKKVLNTISSEVYLYLISLYDQNDGKILIKLLNDVCSLSYHRIIDLLNSLTLLKFKDLESVKILSQASCLLKGNDNLLKAVYMQDNYVGEIIFNRPNFDFKTKVKCILNASKHSEGTHIIKFGNLFLNTQKDGYISLASNISGGESRSLGLFTGDMQFVNQFEMKIFDSDHQKLPLNILNTKNNGFSSLDEMVFGEFVSAKRKRIINGALFERIEFSSNKTLKADILLSAFIKDIFEVRGMLTGSHKKSEILFCEENGVLINKKFDSGDLYGIEIVVKQNGNLIFPTSSNEDSCQVVYQFDIVQDAINCIDIQIQPLLNNLPYVDGKQMSDPPKSYEEAFNIINMSRKTEFARINIESDIPNIQKTIDKSLDDLNMLVSYINLDGNTYAFIDAGLPRYSALFGRDSIITALGLIPLNQDIARDTLQLLAHFQGKSFEDRYKTELKNIKDFSWDESSKNSAIGGLKSFYIQKEEKPGKILHELRVGEFAKNGMIPHSPYYGTVDATPLWIILYAEYYKWCGDKEFLEKLLPNAEAALEWIRNNIIEDYLRFSAAFYSKVKIQNQGWKDSGDSIRHVLNPKDFLSDPEYPIALAEVQGYVYRAYMLMSEIYSVLDKQDHAEKLLSDAGSLKRRFNRDFWLDDEQFYSMALDKNNKPVKNISSNIGHCLAMGIIQDNNRMSVENKLMSAEMFSGWGIRTLGNKCRAFDPISYHNGSVWVHDTAFAAMGLSQESMSVVAKSLFEAANMFEDNRLPELFAGFQRKQDDTSIQEYAEACSPQAWASAGVLWLLLKLIGLKCQNGEICLESANFPDWLKKISISGIKCFRV